MAVPAPRCDTGDKSDAMYVVTDVAGTLSANLDLTAISGKPQWAPQKATIWNDTAAPVAFVAIDESGTTHTVSVPINAPIVLTRPFRTLVDSGAGDCNVIFEWFDPCGSNAWNR